MLSERTQYSHWATESLPRAPYLPGAPHEPLPLTAPYSLATRSVTSRRAPHAADWCYGHALCQHPHHEVPGPILYCTWLHTHSTYRRHLSAYGLRPLGIHDCNIPFDCCCSVLHLWSRSPAGSQLNPFVIHLLLLLTWPRACWFPSLQVPASLQRTSFFLFHLMPLESGT